MKDILLERGIQPHPGPETLEDARQEAEVLRSTLRFDRERYRQHYCGSTDVITERELQRVTGRAGLGVGQADPEGADQDRVRH